MTGVNRIRSEVCFPAGQLRARHGLALFDVTESRHLLSRELPHSGAGGTPIQYFSFTDFLNLVSHLRTFVDLLEYLDQRALLVPSTRPEVHGEPDAYAYFLAHERSFRGVKDRSDFDGWWLRLTNELRPIYQSKLEADRFAALVEAMIEEAHEIDVHAGVCLPCELTISERAMKHAYFRLYSVLVAKEKCPRPR